MASVAGIVSLTLAGCVECDVTPSFSAATTTVNVGDTVVFTDFSTGDIASGTWNLVGASTEVIGWAGRGTSVAVVYNTPGTYDAELSILGRGECGQTYSEEGYITVLPLAGVGCEGITSVTDEDGNTYDVIEIGSQCWMQENLKTTKYKDGNAIPGALDDVAWASTATGAYAIFDNNSANDLTYGKLYNFYAAATGKLCPEGWHVPSQVEWQTLSNTVSADANALKATSNV